MSEIQPASLVYAFTQPCLLPMNAKPGSSCRPRRSTGDPSQTIPLILVTLFSWLIHVADAQPLLTVEWRTIENQVGATTAYLLEAGDSTVTLLQDRNTLPAGSNPVLSIPVKSI